VIPISPEQFENILPLAVEWAEAKEKVILEHGTALSPQYMEDAKSVGPQTPHIESGDRSNSTHFAGNYRYRIEVWHFYST
jgi:hypothetical protein